MKDINRRKKIADIVRKKRECLGISHEKMANDMKLSVSTIKRFEMGKFNLNADLMFQIFDILNIEIKVDNEII